MSRPSTHHIPLNLKMPADRVSLGKRLASQQGMTVSALVSELFSAMGRLESQPLRMHPLLEQLAGVVPDPGQTRQEVVMEALEEKYGVRP